MERRENFFDCRRNHSQRGLFRQPRDSVGARGPRSRRWYLSSYKFSVFVNRQKVGKSLGILRVDVWTLADGRTSSFRILVKGEWSSRRWRCRAAKTGLAEEARHAPVRDLQARIKARRAGALVKGPRRQNQPRAAAAQRNEEGRGGNNERPPCFLFFLAPRPRRAAPRLALSIQIPCGARLCTFTNRSKPLL